MANEIYHQSNWGSPKKDGWGDSYFNPSATNKLYARSDNYENSNGTDKALASKPDTQSVLMTPTAYSVGSMNSILPPYEVLPTELITNGDFATDSDWVKSPSGGTISGGSANFTSGQDTYVFQDIMIIGKKYFIELEYNITSLTTGYFGSNGGSGNERILMNGLSGSGSLSGYITASSARLIVRSSSFNGSIDNVSVKEVRNADFTFDRSSTATRVNKEGLIETVAIDTPRLDYPLIDGVVQDCPALLLEPSRTNSFLQSNQFDTSYNLSSALTLTEDSAISPDGENNAWKLESDGSSGFLQLNQVVSVTGDNTISIFAKKGTNRYLSLRSLSGTDARGQFDLELGEVYGSSNSTATIEHYGNGWYRCSMSFSGTNNAHYFYPNIQGTADSGYIYIYGSQIESGSYLTSYTPTTTATVTRSAETANGAGTSDDFNDSEGVLYAEIGLL